MTEALGWSGVKRAEDRPGAATLGKTPALHPSRGGGLPGHPLGHPMPTVGGSGSAVWWRETMGRTSRWASSTLERLGTKGEGGTAGSKTSTVQLRAPRPEPSRPARAQGLAPQMPALQEKGWEPVLLKQGQRRAGNCPRPPTPPSTTGVEQTPPWRLWLDEPLGVEPVLPRIQRDG